MFRNERARRLGKGETGAPHSSCRRPRRQLRHGGQRRPWFSGPRDRAGRPALPQRSVRGCDPPRCAVRGQACTRVIRSERETEAAALASNPRAPRAIDRLLIRTSARPPGVDDAETVGVDAHAVLLVQAVVAACDGGHAGPSGLRVSVLRFSEARRSSCERVSELAPRSGHEMKGEDSGTTEWGKARTHLFEEVSIDGADAAQADEEDVDLCGVAACCGV